MKRNKVLKLVVLMLALILSLSVFASCVKTEETDPEATAEKTEGPKATEAPAVTEKPKSTTPLVVGYQTFSEKFSPFFADSGYDNDAEAMTQELLLTTDRAGGIVYNAKDGETIAYNGVDYTYTGIASVEVDFDEAAGKTTYLWTLRDDVMFSDGEPLDADDVIFSYYVLCDPTYDGSSTLYSAPIIGINNYRTQTSDEVFAKYGEIFDNVYAAGEDHVWVEGDSWTVEQQEAVWAAIDIIWLGEMQAIVDYCVANYGDYMLDYAGVTPEELEEGQANAEGKKVAAGMALWNFASYAEGVLTGNASGTTWTYANGEFPTIEDYLTEAKAMYGNCKAFTAAGESATDIDIYTDSKSNFIKAEGPKDPSMGSGGVPNIAGIKKLSQTQIEVTTEGFDASAIYKLGVEVAPLHYYGDEALYDYDNNQFGFTFGDLSIIKEKTTMPMGAGPYRFIKFENKIIYYEANEYYYKGEPKTYYMQFKEGSQADFIPGVGAGTLDIADPSFGNEQVEEIKSYNSNKDVTGDVITTNTVDNLGYGFIGLNSNTMLVGTDPASEESKNLRKAFATVLAAYRSLSIDSFYGERASVINYPISNTSWAAPQPSDDGYEVAFSKSVDGDALYTSDMNAEARQDASLEAAVDYLVAAGFTYDEASGKFTAAPEGAKLEYEVIIPADGIGDHPSFSLVTKASEAFAKIGITLIVNDPSDSNVLWDALEAGVQEMFCMAWGATIDPDMYQIYHSDNLPGLPGSSGSNYYHIQDSDLDKLIMDARTSPDQAFRKATYKACLDIIIDWAVEVPIYQRQNCIIFSTERVDMETVTPDITTFYGWATEVENLVMKP